MFFKESENISYKNLHVIRYLPCVTTCMSFGIYPAFAYRSFAPNENTGDDDMILYK